MSCRVAVGGNALKLRYRWPLSGAVRVNVSVAAAGWCLVRKVHADGSYWSVLEERRKVGGYSSGGESSSGLGEPVRAECGTARQGRA
jgi:hypothetical protein